MKDDWFLKWFFYVLVGSLILTFWLASSVYSNSWDNYIKKEVVGDRTVWYDNRLPVQICVDMLSGQGIDFQI